MSRQFNSVVNEAFGCRKHLSAAFRSLGGVSEGDRSKDRGYPEGWQRSDNPNTETSALSEVHWA